jgi:predicted HTH transcriptional regulator
LSDRFLDKNFQTRCGSGGGFLRTEEIESILDGAEETQNLEFKGPMDWDVKNLAKDILAIANVEDGGIIIIGVENDTFKRIGLIKSQVDTYKIDTMKDQLGEYADPHVRISVKSIKDKNDIEFIIINISPFNDLPVICKRDGKDVQKGTLYYRSNSQKPQSARVSNSNDLRDIIERAAVNLMHRFESRGLTVESTFVEELKDELGGL